MHPDHQVMIAPSIRSILLASTDPRRLRRWYETALGAKVDADGWLQLGAVEVLVDQRDDIGSRAAEPGRVIINHYVTDIHEVVGRLDARGETWVAELEHRDAGLWFATVEDPDGNYVQLIELTPSYWVQKRARAGAAAGPLDHARVGVRLPARDLGRARAWYAESLGLEPVEEHAGGLRYRCADTDFVVFASSGRPSGTHAQMTFTVPDLEVAVAALRERGVQLLGEILEVEGHDPSTGARGERAIWFRDSEGNTLGLEQHVVG